MPLLFPLAVVGNYKKVYEISDTLPSRNVAVKIKGINFDETEQEYVCTRNRVRERLETMIRSAAL
jgi:hypothetical protein